MIPVFQLRYFLTAPALLCCLSAPAQAVARKPVVEHFTNTYCSICAGRNPGFYGNLAAFPEVLHIAYYPSAPYPACPFNQMNRPENDARTNFYGIYGGTPRLVINGGALAANENYEDPIIFQREAGTSAFSMQVSVRRKGADSGEATISIRKVAADGNGALKIYAVVAEDTVAFNANNGEKIHYDVFHKSLTGLTPQRFAAPVATGDSVQLKYTFAVGSGWSAIRITAILQDTAGHGVQAARSGALSAAMNVPGTASAQLNIYPNPAGAELYVSGLPAGYHRYTICNAPGQVMLQGVVYDAAKPVAVQGLASGYYIITIDAGGTLLRGAFIRR